MNILQKTNIRFGILTAIVVVVALFFAGLYLVNLQKKQIKQQTENEIRETIDQLKTTALLYESGNLHRVTAGERIAALYLSEMDKFVELQDDSVRVPVVLEKNGGTAFISVNKLMFDNKMIYKNTQIVDKLRYLTNAYVSIWQKCEEGYIRISSNLPEATAEGSIPVFLHNGSAIVQKIEEGKKQYLRESSHFDSEFSVYRPMVFNGYVRLMLQITINEGTPTALEKVFEHNRFYKNGSLFFLNEDDSTIINTDLNAQFTNSALVERIKLETGEYSQIENQVYHSGRSEEQIVSFSQMPLGNRYAGVILPLEDYYEGLASFRLKIIIVLSLVGVLILFLIQLIFYPENRFLKQLGEKLHDFSQGGYMDYQKNTGLFDLSKQSIAESMDRIASYYRKNSNYAQVLSQKDYISNIEPFGDFDIIGNSLLSLKSDLKKLEDEQKLRDEEEELRQRISSGNRKINGILQYASDTESFYFSLIKEIAGFLEVQQAGLFLVQRNDEGFPFIELKSHFAYNEKRIAEKQIGIYEGLIGRCYLERKRIFLKEIPANYTEISSGFGRTSPENIALVPLVFNNDVHGIVEISSVSEIEEYKIEFIENIGESVASTLSNMSISRRTSELLEQTKNQAKQIETQREDLQERIDTHRRQNKKLDKEMLELQEIISSIKIGSNLFEFDLDGNVISANERMAIIVGTSPEQLVGKAHAVLFDIEDDKKKASGIWRDIKAGKSLEMKEKLRLTDGSTREVYSHYIPVRNARRRVFRVLAILSVHFD